MLNLTKQVLTTLVLTGSILLGATSNGTDTLTTNDSKIPITILQTPQLTGTLIDPIDSPLALYRIETWFDLHQKKVALEDELSKTQIKLTNESTEKNNNFKLYTTERDLRLKEEKLSAGSNIVVGTVAGAGGIVLGILFMLVVSVAHK